MNKFSDLSFSDILSMRNFVIERYNKKQETLKKPPLRRAGYHYNINLRVNIDSHNEPIFKEMEYYESAQLELEEELKTRTENYFGKPLKRETLTEQI